MKIFTTHTLYYAFVNNSSRKTIYVQVFKKLKLVAIKNVLKSNIKQIGFTINYLNRYFPFLIPFTGSMRLFERRTFIHVSDELCPICSFSEIREFEKI